MTTRPWFVWERKSSVRRVSDGELAAELELPWDYTFDPDVLRIGRSITVLRGHLDTGQIEGFLEEHYREARWTPSDARELKMGSMFVVYIAMTGRDGAIELLFTPPLYRFCDLDKVVDTVEDVLSPFDFWIQPDIFRERGELLQGDPFLNVDARDDWAALRAGRSWPGGELRESVLRKGSQWDEMVEIVHVAADAWIERYERTGKTSPDPRFAFERRPTPFEMAVKRGLRNKHAVSTGVNGECRECAQRYGFDFDDPDERDQFRVVADEHEGDEFSWRPCEICGTTLGGTRYPWHWLDENNELEHGSYACFDCVMYLANGDIPEVWMPTPTRNPKDFK